jgi:hypothetical protein
MKLTLNKGAPGLPAQNLGIRDQRAAVEWAYNNVAVFGGMFFKCLVIQRQFA